MLLSDDLLLNYKRCTRRAYLNTFGSLEERDPLSPFLLKLRKETEKHKNQVLLDLFPVYHQLQTPNHDKETLAQKTLSLMQQGVECIYRGVLLHQEEKYTLLATPDLLIKQPGKSKFGDWYYFPISIQFGRRPKPEYKLIVTFHALLLFALQGVFPTKSEIVLRDQKIYSVYIQSWIPRLREILQECSKMLQTKEEPEVFISRQRCSLCSWYSHCYAIASSQQHLSLVPGVTPNRYQQLQSVGVATLSSLATISPTNISELIGNDITFQLQKQAQSILENRAILKQTRVNHLPTADIEIYFDIEAEPEINVDYLLGILIVDRQANTEIFYPFLAEKPEEERTIWEQFLAKVSVYTEAPIFHYSPYEVETIKRLAQLYNSPKEKIEPLLSRCVDLHKLVVSSIIFPVESYSLKSIANWLGFTWRDRGVTGDQTVCWYDQWLNTGDRSLLAAILRYNEDDCRATYHLKNWLVEFL